MTGFFNSSSNSLGSWRGRPQENGPNPYFDVQDSVSYLLGKHTFKFGCEFGHIEGDGNVHDSRGRFDFRGNSAFSGSTPLEDFFAGIPKQATQLLGSAVRTYKWTSTAGFVQDDWRITPKLTLNLGLRYTYLSPFREVNNLLGNFDPALGIVQQGQATVGDTLWKPDHKNFSPRVGFAWDVTGKGTTVVRAGSSVMYTTLFARPFMDNGPQNGALGNIAQDATGASCNPTEKGC